MLRVGFPEFLTNMSEPLKDEYLLPIIADKMLKNGTEFSVLPTDDRWFGVTYKEDKPDVVAKFAALKADGTYPVELWK